MHLSALLFALGLGAGRQALPVERQALPVARLPALARAAELGLAPPDERLDLAVSLRVPRARELAAFADAVSDPRSPSYRQFVSPDEVGARFGPAPDELARVVGHLEAHGLAIAHVARNRMAVLASGTVAEAEAAFGTRIRRYGLQAPLEGEPGQFLAPAEPLALPVELAGSVIDVAGLETYTRPRPCVTLLTPTLARGLYGTAPLFAAGRTGAGRTVGISNFEGFRIAEVLSYLNHFALPVPPAGPGTNVAIVPCAGGGSTAGPASGECNMNVQMVLSIAPLATVRVYDSPPGQNLIAVLTQESSDDLCDLISESWTWNLPASTVLAAHNLHLSLTAQGITYVAAGGNSGTLHDPFGYPGYDPEVLVVGGTTANAQPPNGLRFTEVGWTGSGGGWSNNTAPFNVRPPWQVGPGVPPITPATDRRLIPDIAIHAAGSGTGAYPFFTNGVLVQNANGTSFAAPVTTASFAVLEQELIARGALPPDALGRQRLGRVQDLIYAQAGRPDLWFDVVTGSNGTLPGGGASTCTNGWDTVTGWGNLNFALAAEILACPPGGACGGAQLPFCAGDDSVAPCPCDNVGAAGQGCASSAFAGGGRLAGAGTSILSSDTFRLDASDVTGRSVLFLQGTSQSVALPADDGLACVAGTLMRIGPKAIGGGFASYPEPGDPTIGVHGAIAPAGGTYYYQAVYRNAAASFCTSSTSNRTNGLVVTWSP